MNLNPTGRFTDRVDNYVRFRPGYPDGVMATLVAECALGPESVVADVGAGTGILTGLLLRTGARVYAVEPNDAMRAAAEESFADEPNFVSVPATAEATSLDTASVDIVVAGQAFHWFDVDRSRAEFRRILQPSGWLALAWNVRSTSRSPLMREYEAALRAYGTDYDKVTHGNVTDGVLAVVYGGDSAYARYVFDSAQLLDRDGLVGRVMSCSYAPTPDNANYRPLLDALDRMFAAHQDDGMVTIDYETVLYLGQPNLKASR